MAHNTTPVVYTVDQDLQVHELESIQFAYNGHKLYKPSVLCRILAIKKHEFYITVLFSSVNDSDIIGEASYQKHLYDSKEFNLPWQCAAEQLILPDERPYTDGWKEDTTDELGFTGELSKPFEIVWIRI